MIQNEVACAHCGEAKVINRTIRTERFCSQSCSAAYNNARRKKKKKDLCVKCGKAVNRGGSKYCSSTCSAVDRSEALVKRWLNGEYDLAISSTGNIKPVIRRYLIAQAGNKCSKCGWNKLNPVTKKIPLTVDHTDGNLKNAHPKNLKVLCPNCHSLTPTYGHLNKGNGRRLNGFR